MISFASDYIAGAHPFVLQRLVDTNLYGFSGDGLSFISNRIWDDLLQSILLQKSSSGEPCLQREEYWVFNLMHFLRMIFAFLLGFERL